MTKDAVDKITMMARNMSVLAERGGRKLVFAMKSHFTYSKLEDMIFLLPLSRYSSLFLSLVWEKA